MPDDRYVVVPTMDLPQIPYATEEEAMAKAQELAKEHGRKLEIEIRLNDWTLYDRANMRKRIMEWTDKP